MDDLAAVWCDWAEMELQHKQFRKALDLMRRATSPPSALDRRKVCPSAPLLASPLSDSAAPPFGVCACVRVSVCVGEKWRA